MGQIEIVYAESVKYYLTELAEVLYYKSYFSYYETSEEYVNKLKFQINNELNLLKHSTPTFKYRKHK